MNKTTFINTVRFILLILLQVIIFNNINFLGYINPYIYILFIIFFPFDKDNRILFLFFSFLLGLSIDIFCDSGGVHAAACVCTAYCRPLMMRSVFGLSYDYHTIKIEKTHFGQRVNYLIILILTHHFILFSLEIFSFAHILLILKKTIFSAIFTLILCLIFISLFSRKSS
ncbi:rod shape-determining protein MreD [Galbibacter sp. CMA-7]|uniref:Rod shape-determining protein MreD n=1 Tax=Galbibacter pacificus TaxID=2996052 RepID=A0ABT6FW42_9FLAO|nr:rod shape-determining protein MreD [Galbibacter pacificus]MDG3584076.1 rod shape-determining protein MreD [Galbibacter pacificus]MDG3587491.1 rod shape-determining protein MreD [Galbibacter pacificus]